MSSRRPGDWDCGLCRHHNFGFRETCQQCGGPRSSGGGGGGRHSLLPGDWFCACRAHNFANRSSCRSCAAAASSSVVSVVLGAGGLDDDDDVQAPRGVDYGGGGWKHGDWLCTRLGCNQHNFASRKECYRCKAPKGCGQ